MVGTKWVGFPAVGTGAVAQSVDGGLTFRTSSSAYVPITLTAALVPRHDERVSRSAATRWPGSP